MPGERWVLPAVCPGVLDVSGRRKVPDNIRDLLDNLPAKPGVYLFQDDSGRVLYVGKALNLRARVRSYFHKSAGQNPKIHHMMPHVTNIDFIVTESELEALILEMNLIKRHRPRYNVRLKDDKRYPYIKVTWQDDFPKVFMTRRMRQDGARYYGPFTAAWAVHETLHTLRKIFPYLTCDRTITGNDERACLYYDIGLCQAPCIGMVSRQQYRAMIQGLCDFLEGKTDQVLQNLTQEMQQAAENLEFERAAAIRDKLLAIGRIIERQKVVSPELADQDVIALARDDGQACVQVFFIRNGKLIGREYFMLEGAEGEDAREVMASFVKQFYDEAASIPPEILVQDEIGEALIIESWLRDMRGDKVVIRVPQGGQDQALVEMAAENAAETLRALSAQWQLDAEKQVTGVAELQEVLGMDRPPARIECYDISNIQGMAATGSMVVFAKGVPRKSDYRRFRIRTVEGADDYAMMQEVLRRRFRRLVARREGEAAGVSTKADGPQAVLEADAWTIAPDLVIVDGGKGQLNAALEVMQELGIDHIPVIGLAKRKEEIFKPGEPEPIVLPRNSQALFLVQRVRDEAHRFALNYHRRLRRKEGIASILEEIPGIGPKRRQALLKTFGSVERIRQASLEELLAVPGMTRPAAERLKAYL
ncbi:MAG: excinuclease ABC subunit UvrC [Chloroflexi bacterium]|nr:MAG: excinuclease ABC subunit UvrC [Chloroflexota bacterium]